VADKHQQLTCDDLEREYAKVGDFFKRIPTDLRADAAQRLIEEIITWGARNHYEALGICMEALLSHRQISLEVLAEETKPKRKRVARDPAHPARS